MGIANSEAVFLKARQLMPGGVSSPVRAFKAVGGTPIFIKEGKACRLKDIDGNEYIDYVASYGPLIAGHCHEQVVAALSKAIGRGTSFGAPTEAETQLASIIVSALPSVEMVRFVNSGTEAVMSALRLARAATGRERIIKCIGGYHGHTDALLVSAGSGALTLGKPSSPGVPKEIAKTTVLVAYNDLESAKKAFEKYPQEIAAFIVEPVAGNMGVVQPAADYLQGLRKLCDEHGTLLIFDEVMTGFRVAWGGVQTLMNIKPDITCLGKTIGGGLPVGAYGGSKKLMEMISPAGDVYQAGTLSGNPLAMAGGIATLELLKEKGAYELLEKQSARLQAGLASVAAKAKVPLSVNRAGSMLTPFFVKKTGETVTDYASATTCDTEAFAKFFHAILDAGVFIPPSQYEAWFVGLAHDDAAIEQTIAAAEKAFAAVKKKMQPQRHRGTEANLRCHIVLSGELASVLSVPLWFNFFFCQFARAAWPIDIPNPGFEQVGRDGMPVGWRHDTCWGESNFQLEKLDTHGGGYAVRIDAIPHSQGYMRMVDAVDVSPGEILEAGAWVKLRNVPADKSAVIAAEFTNTDGQTNDFAKFGEIAGNSAASHGWTYVHGTIKAPPMAAKMRLRLGFWDSQGSAWFDDVQLNSQTAVGCRIDMPWGEILPAKPFIRVVVIERNGMDMFGVRGAFDRKVIQGNAGARRISAAALPIQIESRGDFPVSVQVRDQKGRILATDSRTLTVPPTVQMSPPIPTHWAVEDGMPHITGEIYLALAARTGWIGCEIAGQVGQCRSRSGFPRGASSLLRRCPMEISVTP